MAQITTLKDKEGNTLYPTTTFGAVLDSDGRNVEDRLLEKGNVSSAPVDEELEDIEPNLITDALRKTPQTLTDAEKSQVLKNLGNPEFKLFVDMWNYYSDIYGGYKPDEAPDKSKPFLLNKLWFSYEEAKMIYAYSQKGYAYQNNNAYRSLGYLKKHPHFMRTVFPLLGTHNGNAIDNAFSSCSSLETVSFIAQANTIFSCSTMKDAFNSCTKLREILTPLKAEYTNSINTTAFKNCVALESVKIAFKEAKVSFADCPKLTCESVEYMILNVIDTTIAKTITVHPDVYAKLICSDDADYGTDNPEDWQALITLAASKNIQFVTV